MALPKLNETPKYDLVIPSTQQNVRFRPYLVKEEKILMMANESKDVKAGLRAVVDTLSAVIDDNFSVNDLTLFDVEYMFTKVRAKSVGETSKVIGTCEECEKDTELDLNLDEIEIPKVTENGVIELTENVSVEMKYPTWLSTLNSTKIFDTELTEIEKMLDLIADSMHTILTEEERINVKEEPRDAVNAFIESMSVEQLDKLKNFLDGMPVVEKKVSFKCSHCSHDNSLMIRNISDFF